MIDAVIETVGGSNGIWWLAGGYFSLVLGERAFAAIRSVRYDDGDALCSIGLNLMSSVLGLILAGLLPLAAYVALFENARLLTLDALWLAIPAAFLIHELAYYAEHRLSHRVGLFWAFHAIHHSSNEFNHTTAARGFFLDGKLQGLFGLSAALLGVPPLIYFGVMALKALYGIWNHASYVGDLGWMERIFATPRIHKVHHGNQPKYIDKNYSQVLSVWDRLFGSFEPYDEAEPPVVGLVNPVYDNNPLTAQFAGFTQLWTRMKTAERWRDRLAYIVMPPEWSHDGVCRSDCPKYAANLQSTRAV
jgi:sterol desaturase/sphingolipid hydroxylase (fatty acid hydroxylase superfamily)